MTMSGTTSRIGGISLLALAAALAAGPALAQAEGQAAPTAVGELIVTGQRLANRRAVEAKRESATISDVLAADDLNRLPDQNLAEALGRVPGVTAFQDEGAGLYVGVRGLSQEFVNLTIDGVEVSSASRTWDPNLRGANLEAVPSTFVRQVEVLKAMTPDLDGDAIAGTVNLVTRSALDARPWFSAGLAAGQYEEDVPDSETGLSGKGSLSFGRAFADGALGVVLDANFRSVERDNLKPDAWFGAKAADELPEEVGGYFYEREETSYGLVGKLEFRPTAELSGFVSASYSDSDTHVAKNKNALYGAVSNPAAMSFTRAVGTARNDDVDYGVDGALTFAAEVDWRVGPQTDLALKASTSQSASYQDDPRVDWYNGGPLSGTYSTDGERFLYDLDAASQAVFLNPAAYGFNGYRRFRERLEKGVDVVRLDLAHERQGETGLGFQFGAKWKSTDLDYTASYLRWRNPTVPVDFAQFVSRADWTFPGTSNPAVVLADIGALSAYAEAIGAGGFRRTEGYDNANDYTAKEAVLAAYGLADLRTERLRIVGGLRYERTEVEARNRFNHAEDGAFVETSGDYGDWLPSAVMTYDLAEGFRLRLAASRAIGRPDVRDLARGETPPDDNGVYERGNPDLEPRRATNLDAALEYDFDGGASLVSISLFHKDIDNEIYDLQTPYLFTDDTGAQINSYFVQPDNAGGARVSGIEIGLTKDRFSFLPAPFNRLGLSANLTLNRGEMDLVDAGGAVVRTVDPEGLSERLANATLFYEGERLSARLAWRYASEQTQQLSVDGSADLILDDYQQTDLHLAYRVNKRLELFGEVWNLFEDEQTFTNADFLAGLPNWYEKVRYGRAVWMGLNLKF